MSAPKLCQPKAGRDSNLELYRLLAMFLIIAHHYVVNSGLTAMDGPVYANLLSWRSQFLLMFGAFGKIGINCFVLITGYFMCTSHISAKKFMKLLLTVVFYKLLIPSIFWITGYEPFTAGALINALLPFKAIAQNFVGTFLVFFLCIPFLNILIRNLTEKQHVLLILLCAFIYILFGSVSYFSVTMNYVSWYMVLYFIASYIRLYPKAIYRRTALWGLVSLGCVALVLGKVVVCSWLCVRQHRHISYVFVSDSNHILAVLTGISSFLFFKNWNCRQSRLVNTLSATCFGVLLIHANGASMRQWLWYDVCQNLRFYSSRWVILHAIGCVVIIFVVCMGLELLRLKLVEKPFFRLWDKHFPAWAEKWSALGRWLCKKLNIGNDA